MTVTQAQALSWRLGRQHLITGAESVSAVVARLGAVPAWLGDANLAVRRRMSDPTPDAVARALEDGDLVNTYSFRGSRQLMTAEDAGVYLAVRGVNRQWELPSWQAHYDLRPADWPALRDAVREALADGPIDRATLVDRVTARARFHHLRAGLSNPSETLLKPLAWQGELCFGPTRDGQLTYQSPAASRRWAPLPDIDDAGRRAVLSYLAGYGPATRANLHHWLVGGLSAGRRRVERWLAELLGGEVVELDVDGQPMLHLREHLDVLAGSEPAPAGITLLPGHDPWVLGPGTDDQCVVPAARRSAVTRGANLVLLAGVVRGTWRITGDTLALSWFDEWFDEVPSVPVDAEAARLAALVQRELDVTVTVS